jgi:hypothetical protein
MPSVPETDGPTPSRPARAIRFSPPSNEKVTAQTFKSSDRAPPLSTWVRAKTRRVTSYSGRRRRLAKAFPNDGVRARTSPASRYAATSFRHPARRNPAGDFHNAAFRCAFLSSRQFRSSARRGSNGGPCRRRIPSRGPDLHLRGRLAVTRLVGAGAQPELSRARGPHRLQQHRLRHQQLKRGENRPPRIERAARPTTTATSSASRPLRRQPGLARQAVRPRRVAAARAERPHLAFQLPRCLNTAQRDHSPTRALRPRSEPNALNRPAHRRGRARNSRRRVPARRGTVRRRLSRVFAEA